jgi:hypothetical protein
MREPMLVWLQMAVSICVLFLPALAYAREEVKSATSADLFTKAQLARGKDVYLECCAASQNPEEIGITLH